MGGTGTLLAPERAGLALDTDTAEGTVPVLALTASLAVAPCLTWDAHSMLARAVLPLRWVGDPTTADSARCR